MEWLIAVASASKAVAPQNRSREHQAQEDISSPQDWRPETQRASGERYAAPRRARAASLPPVAVTCSASSDLEENNAVR